MRRRFWVLLRKQQNAEREDHSRKRTFAAGHSRRPGGDGIPAQALHIREAAGNREQGAEGLMGLSLRHDAANTLPNRQLHPVSSRNSLLDSQSFST